MAVKSKLVKLFEALSDSNFIKCEADSFSDNSASWVNIEDNNFSICFCFDHKGKKLESIKIAKKIWQVVDEKVVISISEPKANKEA